MPLIRYGPAKEPVFVDRKIFINLFLYHLRKNLKDDKANNNGNDPFQIAKCIFVNNCFF